MAILRAVEGSQCVERAWTLKRGEAEASGPRGTRVFSFEGPGKRCSMSPEPACELNWAKTRHQGGLLQVLHLREEIERKRLWWWW